jgi:hypothetical protein
MVPLRKERSGLRPTSNAVTGPKIGRAAAGIYEMTPNRMSRARKASRSITPVLKPG